MVYVGPARGRLTESAGEPTAGAVQPDPEGPGGAAQNLRRASDVKLLPLDQAQRFLI